GRVQKRALNRQMIACRQVMSKDELVMGMYVDELICLSIETNMARNPRYVALGRRPDLFEASLGQYMDKTLQIRSSNQKINISVALRPAIVRPVSLLLAIK